MEIITGIMSGNLSKTSMLFHVIKSFLCAAVQLQLVTAHCRTERRVINTKFDLYINDTCTLNYFPPALEHVTSHASFDRQNQPLQDFNPYWPGSWPTQRQLPFHLSITFLTALIDFVKHLRSSFQIGCRFPLQIISLKLSSSTSMSLYSWETGKNFVYFTKTVSVMRCSSITVRKLRTESNRIAKCSYFCQFFESDCNASWNK